VWLSFDNSAGAQAMDDVIRLRDNAKIDWLLQHGRDVNKPNAKGETPLVTAAGFGFPDMVSHLLDR